MKLRVAVDPRCLVSEGKEVEIVEKKKKKKSNEWKMFELMPVTKSIFELREVEIGDESPRQPQNSIVRLKNGA